MVQQGRSLHNSPPVGIVLDQCRQNVVVPIAGIDPGFVQRNETRGLRAPAVFDEISDLPGISSDVISRHMKVESLIYRNRNAVDTKESFIVDRCNRLLSSVRVTLKHSSRFPDHVVQSKA